MMRPVVRWASEELSETLARLSPQQARGVVRIVLAELEGYSLSSLLDCPDQICTSTTYYGSGQRRGWKDKPVFQEALRLARRDYRQWMLEQSTDEALTLLLETAPEAVRALRQQIVGDQAAVATLERMLQDEEPALRAAAAEQLGATGLRMVVPALTEALKQEQDQEVRQTLAEALGRVAGWLDGDRRAAAAAVLDRGDVRTAAKVREITDQTMHYPDLATLSELNDGELDQLIANLQTALGGRIAGEAAAGEREQFAGLDDAAPADAGAGEAV